MITLTFWIIDLLLILVGIADTVLPALPGTPMIFAGILLAAWIGDFQQISVMTVVVMAVLGGIGLVIDYVATALSAKRVGASKQGCHRCGHWHFCRRDQWFLGASVHAAGRCGHG